VNLLGRPEVVTIGKDFLDRSTLPRPALRTTRGHLRLFCRHGTVVILVLLDESADAVQCSS
jgi:hypothetical protein